MQQKRFALLAFFVGAIAISIALSYLISPQASYVFSSGHRQDSSALAVVSPVEFPENYRQQFMHYATVDCPNSRIVRQMYVNRDGLEAIATTETIPSGTAIVMETYSANQNGEGRLTSTHLNNIFIREKRTDWNTDPDRDPDRGEWQSAWYSPSGTLVSTQQSSCVSCHTMVRDRDFTFTRPALITAAKTGQLQRQSTEFGTSVCR
ncbi:hypothetical protein C7B61_09990 [filamentous cyanobacterium CCP1]|nr:hypothetical protein C7B76_18065 [filamentous cyanobacterium CCP2]PSB66706.1 hypothetical protein C7B61_09990 [filamentous cyanobacterium CCP1]